MKTIFFLFTVIFSPLCLAECDMSNFLEAKNRVSNILGSEMQTGWRIVSENSDSLPFGHHWGRSYDGPRGFMIQLEGPEAIPVNWLSRNDEVWHESFIAIEIIRLWFMPSCYRQSWKRFFAFKQVKGAELLYQDDVIKVFFDLGSVVIEHAMFDDIIDEAMTVKWPKSPANTGNVSWTNWREDIVHVIARD